MTEDPDVKLARDCVTMTLHGPLPIETSMRLAEAVLRLSGELDASGLSSTHRERVKLNPDASEQQDELQRDFVVTVSLWAPPHVGVGAGAGGDTLIEATERALTRLARMTS